MRLEAKHELIDYFDKVYVDHPEREYVPDEEDFLAFLHNRNPKIVAWCVTKAINDPTIKDEGVLEEAARLYQWAQKEAMRQTMEWRRQTGYGGKPK